jgi:hypothetical protein
VKKIIALSIASMLALAACAALPHPSPRGTTARTPTVSAQDTPAATVTPPESPAPVPSATPTVPAVTPSPTAAAQNGNKELAALLPDKAGFEWQYTGFAEYAVTMKLTSVEKKEDARVYTAEGAVADMSGGEGQGDFSVRAVYTVSSGVLRQELTGAMAMDRTLPSLELIRAPLAKGAQWTQAVRDSTGRSVNLACTVTDIRQVNGRTVCFVYYKAEGSDYYEKREITEGMGVTAYDKLYMYDAGREEIGYRLYTPEKADMAGWDQWLPRLDYEYAYFGLAEYGHKGSLSKVSASETEIIYEFNGSYDDATGDYSRFTVRYRVDLTRGTVTE